MVKTGFKSSFLAKIKWVNKKPWGNSDLHQAAFQVVKVKTFKYEGLRADRPLLDRQITLLLHLPGKCLKRNSERGKIFSSLDSFYSKLHTSMCVKIYKITNTLSAQLQFQYCSNTFLWKTTEICFSCLFSLSLSSFSRRNKAKGKMSWVKLEEPQPKKYFLILFIIL